MGQVERQRGRQERDRGGGEGGREAGGWEGEGR